MSDYGTTVMRKRRQRAIDPSLGYYIANNLTSPKRSKAHDTAVIVPSPVPAGRKNARMRTPACIITVDDFLRVQNVISNELRNKDKNEKRTIRQDYLRLRSRTVTRTVPRDLNSQKSTLSTKAPSDRKRRPFKERIYEAAIATCVDPIRSLAQPVDTPHSKPPLRFEPVDLSYARSAPATERKLRVVNPLKPSSFSGLKSYNEQRLPMIRWQVYPPLNGIQGGDYITPEVSCRPDGNEQAQLTVPSPLVFVPLSRAETAYKIMFPPPLQQ